MAFQQQQTKVAIYESLFHAHKENLERKEIIIPNMKAYLKKGNRFSASPLVMSITVPELVMASF